MALSRGGHPAPFLGSGGQPPAPLGLPSTRGLKEPGKLLLGHCGCLVNLGLLSSEGYLKAVQLPQSVQVQMEARPNPPSLPQGECPLLLQLLTERPVPALLPFQGCQPLPQSLESKVLQPPLPIGSLTRPLC